MKKILVLPGDGIGPEITAQAVKVLTRVSERFGRSLQIDTAPVGGCAYEETGTPLPEETLRACRSADAILLGAVGGPKWDALPREQRPERGLLALRAELGLYANLRPAAVRSTLVAASPLSERVLAKGFNLLVVRELASGIYFGKSGMETQEGARVAFDEERYDEHEIARIAHTAFAAARGRNRRVHLVDKANVLASSRLWREVVAEVHRDYADCECHTLYVDNAAMQLVLDPSPFDVILTSNLFGDILSDLAAALTGSIGLLPSASLGETVHLYEPIHGSAPALAGQDVANPIGTILSVAMMLRHSFGWEEEARAIEAAVETVLAQGHRTADLAGTDTIGCVEMGERICHAVE